ncbi:MAG: TetR/AcrR family transcriptional regulator [Gammaproteobacteria bacterium]|nr:TetR/AcrR family transcriptional regulator [Gammaproteobacteria bacterium]MDH5239604.1 TetR/AcrR family transcriptional regulator [Gammaproteobacteria bacterium]MDH5261056.1 TetR/AcrR family transcriptional regulator [Gammaproteobacteria bacterium]MDH5582391.1 TetR/AcrR family transcriptional regulator [Gammaproteobacteria bacterium]
MATSAEETRFELQKTRMLRAAAQCFNQKGYSGTSLRDVADVLGLTDPALYYYVRNKQELVYLCYVRAADLGREALDRALSEGRDGMDVMLRYLRYHIEMMVGDRGPIAIMSEVPSLKPEHREEVLQLSRTHGKNFEAVLQAGIRDGSIADCNVRMTGNAIMGSINWIPKWYHGDAEQGEKLVNEFPEILARGLSVD